MDSFWSVANALKDAVKQQTADLAASLQSTDWKSELTGLQDGLKEESVEISQKAKEVTEELGHKTIEVAKNLPQVVDEGRRKAVAQLEHLPGTSAAHVQVAAAQLQQAGASLTKMGQRVVNNTTEMLDHFSSAIQAEMDATQEMARTQSGTAPRSQNLTEGSKFSRFDADVAAMQRDSSTYCDEPDDDEDFETWCSAFDLPGRKPDITKLLSENTFMSELQARIVPVVVDYESFWTRYYYRLHKLEERHAKVTALAMRAEAGPTEDEVGWGMDDDDEEEERENINGGVPALKEVEKKEMSSVKQAAGVAAVAAVVTGVGLGIVASGTEEQNALLDGKEDASLGEARASVEVVEEEGSDGAEISGDEVDVSEAVVEKKEAEKKVDDADLDDDMSSLDLSGGEDLGDDGDDTGSDWGEVAEWE